MKSVELQINSNPVIRFLWLGLGLFCWSWNYWLSSSRTSHNTSNDFSFCLFLRSSKLLHWVLSNKYYGESVKNFLEGKGISKKAKSFFNIDAVVIYFFGYILWSIRLFFVVENRCSLFSINWYSV